MTRRHRPLSWVEILVDVIHLHPADAVSRLLERRRTLWWVPIGVAIWLYLAIRTAVPLYEAWGMSRAEAALLTIFEIVSGACALGMMCLESLRGVYSRLRPRGSLTLLTFAPATLYSTAALNAGSGVPLAAAVAIGSAVSLAVFAYARHSLLHMPAPVGNAVWLDDPASAADLARDCDAALVEESLTGKDRARVEANLAGALAVLAMHSDHYEALPRAYGLIAGSVDERESISAYLAASHLAEANRAKAHRTGDSEGYEGAVQLMFDAASLLAQRFPCVLPRARLIRGTHLAVISRRAGDEGQPGRSARLHDEALDDVIAAIRGSRWRPVVRALAEIEFASLVDRASGDLDSAIELCGGALRRLRIGSRLDRDRGRLVLCDLLRDRAADKRAGAVRDVAQATRLCRRLCGRPAVHADAVSRLPMLLRFGGAAAPEVAQSYRRAFDAHSLMAGSGAADVASEWSSWALGGAATDETAEAHWCWLRAVADDARRRPQRAEKELGLSRFLGLAARAGECLIEAGRLRDAAVAFDAGRAMLLAERMDRDRVDICGRLTDSGRPDLAERWLETGARMSEADRIVLASRPTSTGRTRDRGRLFTHQFTTADQLALADREQLLREISLVPGCADIHGPPRYDDLRQAAVDGPIVYVSATDTGAVALTVGHHDDPTVTSLRLTAADVGKRAHQIRNASDAAELSSAFAELLPWLWDMVMEPVVAGIAGGSLVTLIPLGAMAWLPLHVGGMEQGNDGVWRDQTGGLVFRYAPNARVLGRAQAHARSLAGTSLRVLTVDAPAVPGAVRLEWAGSESAGVHRRFGRERAERPTAAAAAAGDVLDAMDRCEIWHFACHGTHNPHDPLESSLELRDGRLKLRTIYARPAGARRLAVLSACRTAAAGEMLLDEVVSFPSGLLEAGVAGVVCSQSDVGDREAMLLVLRFFDELVVDGLPAHALARAQRWLCGATNAQVHAALPDVYPLPADYDSAELASWRERREFVDPYCWAPFSFSGA